MYRVTEVLMQSKPFMVILYSFEHVCLAFRLTVHHWYK